MDEYEEMVRKNNEMSIGLLVAYLQGLSGKLDQFNVHYLNGMPQAKKELGELSATVLNMSDIFSEMKELRSKDD